MMHDKHTLGCCGGRSKDSRQGRGHNWPRWLLPATGLLALAWFLARVVPKPSRATYPCQRVAMPLASGFVAWLIVRGFDSMERIPEPEVMEDQEQAIAYARADFSSSNQAFVDGLLGACSRKLGRVLDIGCGPADIAIRLARATPSIHVTAVDASEAMVRLAREAVREAGLDEQIAVARGRIPGLHVPGEDFGAILSKDLLHHLPDPMVFWEEAKRLGRPGTVVYVMDLFRPESPKAARDIVESVSGDEPEILQRDFYNSLLAAFTPEEIEDQLRCAGLEFKVDTVSERHMCIKGSFK